MATAIFAAGALFASVLVSFALVPDVIPSMMAACEEAQGGQGPWALEHHHMHHGSLHDHADPMHGEPMVPPAADPDVRLVLDVAPVKRRLQQLAVDNCDELLAYTQDLLPMILLLNMMMQGGLLFAATSTAKKATILLLKARQLGAVAI